VLAPLAYATDNTVGIWYEGTDATTVVSDAPVDPDSGPAAYKVELIDARSSKRASASAPRCRNAFDDR